MKRSELLSRIIVVAAVVAAVGTPLYLWSQTSLIHARMAENGGWHPDVIHAEVDRPLHLRLTSDDVMHGFAVGQMEMDPVDVEPGRVTDITLAFERPGVYTFYCTRWCGLNHWRMRGTIEVQGASASSEPAPPPLYVSLNLDIDAPHAARVIPAVRPSARSGQQLAVDNAISLPNDDYLTQSPFEAFENLKNTPLSDVQRWDVVAYLWQSNTNPEALASGKQLYTRTCGACHGENGAGDGVFAEDLEAAGDSVAHVMSGAQNMQMQTPADLTDPVHMLGASPALLQGKILRGGMGTGMPMWGSIFTEQQIWDVIAYLYSFQFEYQR